MKLDHIENINYLNQNELKKAFLEPKYTLKDIQVITYRTINYWDESGFLLRKRRKTERGWRRFSLIEFLWIKLLDELRELNINIDSTVPLLFKAVGFDEKSGKKGIEEAQLTFLSSIIPCITEKEKVRMLIFDNKVEIKNSFQLENELLLDTNYISISLNKLLIDFVLLQQARGIYDTPLLNGNESELLTLLNQGEVLEVSILLKAENLLIDCNKDKKEQSISKSIGGFYKPYSVIIYKTKGGKTVEIKRK